MARHVIKNSVGGVALALISAFNVQAEAVHPLLEFSALTYLSGDLPEKIAATGVPLGEGLGGGAVKTLEAALKNPNLDYNSPVYYPANAGVGDSRVVFAIRRDKSAPVYACIENVDQYNKTHQPIQWRISPGIVTPDNTQFSLIPGTSPCESWTVAAIQKDKKVLSAQLTRVPVKAQESPKK